MDELTTDTLKETLKAIDDLIAEQKVLVSRGESLGKLMEDPGFVDVILKGYVEEVAAKLFKSITDPEDRTLVETTEAIKDLEAIRRFKAYLGDVMVNAKNAPLVIAREEDYRKQVTATNGDTI